MLAIRMQRTGRKGHAMFRVVVQDARRTPTSGKIVARLGSYDPHAKTVTVDKEKASFYLEHGAQPSDRVASLLAKEGVKLPEWVKLSDKREGSVRNPDKRRSTRPDEPAEAAPVKEASAEAAVTETTPAASNEADQAATEPVSEEPATEAETSAEESNDEQKPTESEGGLEEALTDESNEEQESVESEPTSEEAAAEPADEMSKDSEADSKESAPANKK